MRHSRLFGASVTMLALAVPVLAQENPHQDEPVLVIGSRNPLPLSEVTAAATIITGDELTARGDVFVADALRRVAGLAVNRSGPTGALTQVRLRGSEANHVLVLVDGMEASNPFTGSFNFANADSSGVNRIEILRGEQSALWGTDAIGGVIQISSEPIAEGDQMALQFEGGSFDTYSGSASASHTRGRLKLWGTVSGKDSEGYDVSGQNGERDGYSQITATVGANVPINQNWLLKARGRIQNASSQFDADTDFDGRLNDVDRQLDTDIAHGRLAVAGETSGGHLQHEGWVSYLDSETNSGGSRSVGKRTRIGWQSTGNWQTGNVEHRLTGLVEGRFEDYENDGGPGAGQNQIQSNDQWAVAGQYAFKSGPLVLSASGRHEENDLFANSNAFRAGLAWNVAAVGGKFRASVGQGFKNPGFFELFGFFPAFFVGNPDLVAEKSTGYEIGWDQQFTKGSASITLFTSDLENEIFTDFGVFPATARNRTGKSTRKGIELSGEAELIEGLHISGSMSFLRSEENNLTEIRRPNFLASASIFWVDPSQKWQVSLGVDHNGDMQDTDFGTFQRVTLPAYTLVRGKISRKMSEQISIYIRGENLTNTSYSEVFSFAGQERGIYGGLVANF